MRGLFIGITDPKMKNIGIQISSSQIFVNFVVRCYVKKKKTGNFSFLFFGGDQKFVLQPSRTGLNYKYMQSKIRGSPIGFSGSGIWLIRRPGFGILEKRSEIRDCNFDRDTGFGDFWKRDSGNVNLNSRDSGGLLRKSSCHLVGMSEIGQENVPTTQSRGYCDPYGDLLSVFVNLGRNNILWNQFHKRLFLCRPLKPFVDRETLHDARCGKHSH